MKPKQPQIKFSSVPKPDSRPQALRPTIHPARQNNSTRNGYKSSNITIDRLILHLPNLSPAQARELAHRVGIGLAAARPAISSPSFSSLPIELDPRIPTGDLPRLSDAIVHALLTQMERS